MTVLEVRYLLSDTEPRDGILKRMGGSYLLALSVFSTVSDLQPTGVGATSGLLSPGRKSEGFLWGDPLSCRRVGYRPLEGTFRDNWSSQGNGPKVSGTFGRSHIDFTSRFKGVQTF